MKALVYPKTLVHALQLRATRTPEAAAFSWLSETRPAETLSYAALSNRAAQIAVRLAQTTKPGDRALLLFGPGLDFVSAFLGCLWAGVVAVPAYPPRNRRHHPRLNAIVRDAQPTVILTGSTAAGKLDEWLNELPLALTRIDTGAIDPLELVQFSAPLPKPQDLALLQYTSGSTSTPKGVMVTHANICNNSESLKRAFELGEHSVSVCWLPSFHDMGLIDGVVQPLYTGFPAYLLAPSTFIQRPASWLEAITRYRATHCGGPNFGFDACVVGVSDDEVEGLDLSSWETAYNGAEPVRPATLDAFARKFARSGFQPRQFYPCYGLAEATLIVTGGAVKADPAIYAADAEQLEQHRVRKATGGRTARQLVGCGAPVHDTQVRIVNPETLKACQPSEVGEIWVAGTAVASGYWRHDEATAATFQVRLDQGDETYLRTGDLGFFAKGELFVTGRIKDLVIIRGRNHYPQDIEATSRAAHPSLERGLAAAFSLDHEGDEKLIVVQEVARTQARSLEAEGVIRAIRTAIIESHEVDPWQIVLVPALSLPKTSSGKLQRAESRRMFLADEFRVLGRSVNSIAAPDAGSAPDAVTGQSLSIAEWLRHALARALAVPLATIEATKPFASFGLDSLAATRLAGELQIWLGRPVSATWLYDYPTVEKLAAHLAGDHGPAANPAPAMPRDEPIAIIGIGCRFPSAHGPEQFWRLLQEGRSGVVELPPGRWPDDLYDPEPGKAGKLYSTRGGFVDDVDKFDAAFFGISPNEADRMDPQQRLLLETTWEACEDAGIPPSSLAGSDTGVFVGISTADYRALQFAAPWLLDHLAGTGNAASIAANRISYALDLQGPSLAVDTACSSSLLALHLACQSLRRGECVVAAAGGVNLMLTPDLTVAFSQARMLSPDGRCKTFDAAADGYVRGEGCGIVLLKRMSDAVRDGDRIAAVILSTATNQDGRTNGLTAPNGLSQQRVLRTALAQSGLQPADVQYVEAHGTGTTLGDPIEMHALCAVYGEGRAAAPLYVGSVKTNIGHLEAAAGIAAVIKTALSLRERTIPPHLHFQALNPQIDLGTVPVRVPTAVVPWPAVDRVCAGVSSFGFGGTNVHAILEAAPASPPRHLTRSPNHEISLPLLLSARSEAALRQMAEAYRAHLGAHPDARLEDVGFTALAGRESFPYRIGVAGKSAAETATALENWLRRPATVARSPRPRVAFLYTGQGSQYPGMGAALYETEGVYRDVIDRCAAFLRNRDGIDLLAILNGDPETLALTRFTQPAIYAVQCALTALWRSKGLECDAVMGHSVGEFAAAWAAGVFDLEAGLGLIADRGRLMTEACEVGAMAAVAAPRDRVTAFAREAGAEIAAFNAPQQSVVCGTPDAVARVVAACEQAGIAAHLLNTTRAFHSALMEPALPALLQAAAGINYRAPGVTWISNLTGAAMTDAPDAAYWVSHARQPVRFADGAKVLDSLGLDVFVEIGPDPILLGLARRTITTGVRRWVPSLDRRSPPLHRMAESVAELHAAGASFAAPALFPTGRRMSVPSYPFARDRHWFDAGAVLPRPSAAPEPASEVRAYEVEWEPRAFANAASGPAPAALCAAIAAREPQLREASGIADFPQALDALEGAAVAWAHSAFARLAAGVSLSSDADSDVVDDALLRVWAERLKIAPRHRRLAARTMRMLIARGLIGRVESAWVVHVRTGGDLSWRDVSAPFPEVAHEAQFLERCGPHLAEVLTGEIDPLRLLFPGGDFGAAAALYAEAPVARLLNGQAAAALHEYLKTRDRHDPLRILELGAGTGGLTSALLPVIAAWGGACEYVFTDLSQGFLEQARARFAAYPFVDYRLLDLEDLDRIEPDSYDLAVAANAVHAVARLRPVLRGLHALLKPCGHLWLLEGVRPQAWLDLTFGLTEGWWKAADGDGRSDYPLLPVDRWFDLFESCGFQQCTELSASADFVPYALISAARPAGPEPVAHHARWLVAADRSALSDGLDARLSASPFARVDIDSRDATFERRLDQALASLNSHGPESPTNVVLCLDRRRTSDADGTVEEAVVLSERMLEAVRAVTRRADARLWVVTRGARPVAGDDPQPDAALVSAASVLWGLGKTMALEHPAHWGGLIDLDPAGDSDHDARGLIDEISRSSAEDQQVWRGATRWVPRLSASAMTSAAWPAPRGSVLITGGTGALGLQAALALAQAGYRHLCLMSRSGTSADGAADLARLRATGAVVTFVAGDAATPSHVDLAIEAAERDGVPLQGVVHAAGVAHAKPLAECTRADLELVYRAKVGAPLVLIDRVERAGQRTLDFFVTFSSMVSLWGAKGQGVYVAGNHFLDDLATARRGAGRPAVAINWGPVAGGGMVPAGELAHLAALGVTPLPLSQVGALLMRHGARASAHAALVAIDWPVFRAHLESRAARPFFTRLASAPLTGVTVAPPAAAPARNREDVEQLAAFIRSEVASLLGYASVDRVDPDRGFFEIGLDSLTIIKLKTSLEVALGVTLPATLALEYPTVVKLARRIHALGTATAAALPAAPRRSSDDPAQDPAHQPIAIVGIGCRYPGGVADPESFWALLRDGVDAVGPFPADRWGEGPPQSADPDKAGTISTRNGGFITDVDLFDAPFFRVSAREASNMDPQHRLLLQVAWETIEDAGAVYPRDANARVGVFVGATGNDYARRVGGQGDWNEIDAYYATGNAANAAPGRVSYLFGFCGPSIAIDTACSSSLIAVKLAIQSLRAGECDAALAGGVNLILSQETTVSLSRARVLSPEGRCRTFDAAADGMARAEGCGLVLLKPLSRAIADRDRVYAVITAAAANQDGASGGFTVPSRDAQEDLVRRALALAGASPASIDYIEAHGTGTPLGDPIEAHALAAVFRDSHTREHPLRIGSVKTNLGHTESASGVAGLIKTTLALHHDEIPPQLHFHVPSPKIDWANSPLQVVTHRTAWPRGRRPRRAGVSSFGLSGTNAHLIIEEAPARAAQAGSGSAGPVPIVVSAATEAALLERRRLLAELVRTSPDLELRDLSYTLTARRAALKYRWASVCGSREEAVRQLTAETTEGLPAETAATDAAQAATAYARGSVVDWAAYWRGREGRLVSLPRYPFQSKSYWKELRQQSLAARGMPLDVEESGRELAMKNVAEVRHEVVDLMAGLLEEQRSAIDVTVPLLDLGADSIILTEVVKAVADRYGVELAIRQMFESLTTVDALVHYIVQHQRVVAPSPLAVAFPATATLAVPATTTVAPPVGGWEQLMAQQFQQVSQIVAQVVQQQLDFLKSQGVAPAPAERVEPAAKNFWKTEAPKRQPLTPEQEAHLAKLTARYVDKTKGSKAREQADRRVFADMRTAIGFRLETKELSYPIIAQRSSGASFWDVDGNRYVDMCMGFGVAFFGHQPPLVTQALEEQLREGFQVGPQSRHAGEVARLICELTGMDRVTFCNSGTEAVMTAIRVARAATGKQKIVTFSGSYHGHADATLALSKSAGADPESAPMAPGVAEGAIQDTLVLPYGVSKSLEIIEKHASTLAAVLVEPVQSRRPGFHPAEFLQQLRAITKAHGVPLIFDEMITGFRIHPGGSQVDFGIDADITTYGKLIGGGLPLGVVACRGAFLDRIDGGAWQYGDDSYPAVERTFYAGTFCKHPLSMAAARAVLSELASRGPALQAGLNRRTAEFVASINAIFNDEHVPFSLVHYGSLMRFNLAGNFSYLYQPLEMDLLCYHLIERGIYIWEGRTLFLSTAHSDDDLDTIRHAVRESVREIKAGGFLLDPDPPPGAQGAPSRAADVPATTRHALTEAQRDFWVLAQMGPDGSNAAIESVAIELSGGVDPAHFASAVQWLVDRHQALRMVIDADGRGQEVNPSGIVDLQIDNELTGDTALRARMHDEAERVFDLVKGPLFRARLWRVSADQAVIALYAHHIITDGWSMGLLLGELGEAYAAFAAGRAPSLPPAPRFTDYLAARDARLASADGQTHRRYWSTRLAGPQPKLDLPFDAPRPPVKTFGAARHVTPAPAALYAALNQLSARHGCSVFMTLLAGYAAFLHRMAGGPAEVIVGVPVSGRGAGDDPRVAGLCTHLLPLRIAVDPRRSFADLMRGVRDAMLEAVDHQDWPFGRMLDDISVEPDLSRTPVFTTTFNLDRPLRRLSFGGIAAHLVALPGHYTTYDLAFNIVIDGDQLLVSCDGNRDLLDEETLRRWLDQYLTLLDGAVRDASQAVAALPLLDEAARTRVLVDWNDTAEELPEFATLHGWIEAQAARTPSAEAIRCAGRSLTYAELEAKAVQIASALIARGVVPGQLVGVALPRSADLVAALLGVLKAGAAYLPLDPSFPSPRLRRMVEHSGMQLIVTDSATEKILHPAFVAGVATLRLDVAAELWSSGERPSPALANDGPAYVIYTSASTGEPKGVVVGHRSVINLLNTMAGRLKPGAADRWLAVTTVSFDISVLEIFLPLTHGFTLVLADDSVARDGKAIASAIDREGITLMQATPAGWRLLIESGWRQAPGLTMICGGEAMPVELAADLQRRGKALWNVYGPTETTIWSTAGLVPEASAGETTIAIGRPLGNTQIYITDEHGQPQPPGVPGELLIAGLGLAHGYHRDEAATTSRFVRNPLATGGAKAYRTGDLARWRPDGTIEFLGRLDHQVKVRGFRIELGEIETWLSRCRGIAQAVVDVREVPSGERRLAAYYTVTPATSPEPTDEELRRGLAAELPEYMVPDTFTRLAALPLTPAGKVDRRSLPAPVPASAAVRRAPVSDVEQRVAGIWIEILQVPEVGLDDDFLALGGNSLLAARLAARLGTEFSVNVTLRSLLEQRTLGRVATHVETLQWAASGGEKPAEGSGPPVELTL